MIGLDSLIFKSNRHTQIQWPCSDTSKSGNFCFPMSLLPVSLLTSPGESTWWIVLVLSPTLTTSGSSYLLLPNKLPWTYWLKEKKYVFYGDTSVIWAGFGRDAHLCSMWIQLGQLKAWVWPGGWDWAQPKVLSLLGLVGPQFKHLHVTSPWWLASKSDVSREAGGR